MIAHHNAALCLADHIGPMLRASITDSQIVKGYHCARSKTACILNYALAPYLIDELVSSMKQMPYSLSVDGSNDTGLSKMNPLTGLSSGDSTRIQASYLRTVHHVAVGHIAAYVFEPLLRKELHEFKERWNQHRIRYNRRAVCPGGVPDDLYTLSDDCEQDIDPDVLAFLLVKRKDKILGTREDDPQTPSCEEVPEEHREICARSTALNGSDRPSAQEMLEYFKLQ
ncbi:hypothetical protein EMCRGX_G020396 [Ephydatia muelleri]